MAFFGRFLHQNLYRFQVDDRVRWNLSAYLFSPQIYGIQWHSVHLTMPLREMTVTEYSCIAATRHDNLVLSTQQDKKTHGK